MLSFGAWHMYRLGRASGYDQGWSVAYKLVHDEQAAASWANTSEGQRAYRMAQWDSLSMLAGCTTEGWVIQGGYCFPHPDKDNKVHGWRISAE